MVTLVALGIVYKRRNTDYLALEDAAVTRAIAISKKYGTTSNAYKEAQRTIEYYRSKREHQADRELRLVRRRNYG